MNVVFDNGLTRLAQGDCRDVLAALPEQSVHMVVTSPPYYGLRVYQGADPDKVLGSEPTPEAYVANMVEVFRAVKRVLRDDGTLWLNLGPTWAGSGGAGGDYADDGLREGQPKYRAAKIDWPAKCMVPIPWMVGLALIQDGWILRSEIIWDKPAPMPESVTDRPTKSHEQILLLVKQGRYYYDAQGISEPLDRPDEGDRKTPARFGGADKWHEAQKQSRLHSGNEYRGTPTGTRNARSVWRIAPEPSPEKHYAMYPSGLPRRCILAGTSERGCCPECGAQWVRQVEKSGGSTGQSWHDHENDGIRGQRATDPASKGGHGYKVETLGWAATCAHGLAPVPSTILDPFAGTATSLAVAQELGRRSIGIELSPDYAAMAARRLGKVPLAFAGA